MNKKFLWIGLAILFLGVAVIAIVFNANRDQHTYNGSVIDPPVVATNFFLTNQDNQQIELTSLRGKYVLLFFGFTHCPDICPATMGVLMQVRDQLKDQADKVQVVFVTTDPARDSPEAIGEFVNRFDETFIGLTGSQGDLQKVWKDYGVIVLDNGETHSTRVYLVDPDGKIKLTYPSANSAEDIIADLNLLFKES
jgi:protein SCO1/2